MEMSGREIFVPGWYCQNVNREIFSGYVIFYRRTFNGFMRVIYCMKLKYKKIIFVLKIFKKNPHNIYILSICVFLFFGASFFHILSTHFKNLWWYYDVKLHSNLLSCTINFSVKWIFPRFKDIFTFRNLIHFLFYQHHTSWQNVILRTIYVGGLKMTTKNRTGSGMLALPKPETPVLNMTTL